MKRRLMLFVATSAICVLGYGLRGSAQQAPTSASAAEIQRSCRPSPTSAPR